tara:strand:- start:3630 stop:4223 length:594 start_codon:yes stop_codon:yes gene_type:complete
MNKILNTQLTKQVIIGTKSKSRKNIFRSLSIKFNYRSANIDEKKVLNLKNNKNDALKIAIAKAKYLSSKYENKIIITFDTTILFQRKTIYKCDTMKCCSKLLKLFGNKKHRLYTGMVFMINNKIIQKKLTSTDIMFKKNNINKINKYVKKNFSQIRSAVGCYNIESYGKDLFQNINKSYYNILGIDIINFLKMMRKV